MDRDIRWVLAGRHDTPSRLIPNAQSKFSFTRSRRSAAPPAVDQHTPFIRRCGNVDLFQDPPFGRHRPARQRRASIVSVPTPSGDSQFPTVRFMKITEVAVRSVVEQWAASSFPMECPGSLGRSQRRPIAIARVNSAAASPRGWLAAIRRPSTAVAQDSRRYPRDDVVPAIRVPWRGAAHRSERAGRRARRAGTWSAAARADGTADDARA